MINLLAALKEVKDSLLKASSLILPPPPPRKEQIIHSFKAMEFRNFPKTSS